MNQNRPIAHYVLAYLCWFVSTALAVLILNLARETILLALTVRGASLTDSREAFYQSLRAGSVAQWSWLFVGLITIGLLVGFEHLYRGAAHTNTVWRSFFLVTGIEAAVLFLVHTIFISLGRTFRPVGWWSVAIPAVEALLAALFLWLWSTRRRKLAHE
jgi:hypothetical protein